MSPLSNCDREFRIRFNWLGNPHRKRLVRRPESNHRRLNIGVDVVPLSAVHVPQANHDGEDTNGQARHTPAHHHLRLVDSVTSLRYPPPGYPAHHLDPRYDAVAYGRGNIGHAVGRTVDIVLAPLPPPSYTTHPGGGHPSH
ncbi:hypothetical protein M407DRAFT_19475 [Tulasnella calospora MUT 4182]|uniref:Uncharacterized protein n=1 Tax=Tulasnella calospora MUT 4182 TaxID=1051891 RepID=A0A0C3QTI4_9AGAM|nr:hypothetical protein M407DRAFT_19475 [Tulasnella calospora MUT 4182]